MLGNMMERVVAVSGEEVGTQTDYQVWSAEDHGDLGKNCFGSRMGLMLAYGLWES